MVRSGEQSSWSGDKQMIMEFLKSKQVMALGLLLASVMMAVMYAFTYRRAGWGYLDWETEYMADIYFFTVGLMMVTCCVFLFSIRATVASQDFLILNHPQYIRVTMKKANRLFSLGVYMLYADVFLMTFSYAVELGIVVLIVMVVLFIYTNVGWSKSDALRGFVQHPRG